MLTGGPIKLLYVPPTDPEYALRYSAIKLLFTMYEQHCFEYLMQLKGGRHVPNANLDRMRASLVYALEAFDAARQQDPSPSEAEPS